MTNAFYNITGNPVNSSRGSSPLQRAEFALIQAGFDLLPTIAGNGNKFVVVNAGGTALSVLATPLGISNGGTGAATAAAARVTLFPTLTGNAGKVLAVNVGETDLQYISAVGTGTVTSVQLSGGATGLTVSGGPITAAGTITLAGTLVVANGGTGAATLTGVLKGNGTSALTAATAGTDYSAGTAALATGLLKSTTATGALTIATAGTDYLVAPAGTSLLKANSGGALANAVAGTDYVPPGVITSSGLTILTANLAGRTTAGTGALESIAVSASLSLAAGVLGISATPALGTPSALVGTNISGTATGLTTGITNALKSASTTVDVSSATAPSAGQVLTATGTTAATWQTPSSGTPVGATLYLATTQGAL